MSEREQSTVGKWGEIPLGTDYHGRASPCWGLTEDKGPVARKGGGQDKSQATTEDLGKLETEGIKGGEEVGERNQFTDRNLLSCRLEGI